MGLVKLTAIIICQLQATDRNPEFQEMTERIALLGGWLGRKRDPIVLMRELLVLPMTLEASVACGKRKLSQIAKSVPEEWGFPSDRIGMWRNQSS